MSIFEEIIEKYNLNKNKINKISILSGNIIQSNIFDSKINYKSKNIDYFDKIIDLLPLINVLFNKFIINFEYFNNQQICFEDKELHIQQKNTNTIKHFFKNKLIDYKIFNKQFTNCSKNLTLIQEDILVKYKNNKNLELLQFTNLKTYNNIEKNKIIKWEFEGDICLFIKINSNYLNLELDININEINITQKKKRMI